MSSTCDPGNQLMPVLKPYSNYKQSGVKWLGEAPAHWEVPRLKTLCDMRSGEAITAMSIEETGKYPVFGGNGLRGYGSDYTHDGHFVLIGRQGALCGNVHSAHGRFWASEHAVVARLSVNHVLEWFARLLEVMNLNQYSIAAAQPGLSVDRVLNLWAPVPPTDEQADIARYLDRADRRILRCIHAKEKRVELLEEQQQALVNEAVTGRIDVRTGKPYPAYKPSGVKWLGEAPAHWEVPRLKTLCDMRSGEAITAMSIEETGKYPVFGGNGLRGYGSDYTHDGHFVLIGRQGALCGNVHSAHGRFWASEHAVVARLSVNHVLEWFARLLEVMNLNQYSIAAAQPGLSVDRVLNLWAPVPPTDEQADIARYLDRADQRIRRYIRCARRQIELLNEYRTRLIADVITGKLDVQEAAAALPDVDPLAAKGADKNSGEDAAAHLGGLDVAPSAAEATA